MLMQLLIRWSEVYNTSSYRQVKVVSQHTFAIALTKIKRPASPSQRGRASSVWKSSLVYTNYVRGGAPNHCHDGGVSSAYDSLHSRSAHTLRDSPRSRDAQTPREAR